MELLLAIVVLLLAGVIVVGLAELAVFSVLCTDGTRAGFVDLRSV